MGKSNFMRKFNLLVAEIRERGSLTLGEACTKIGVGPWQIREYAKAIVGACGDIRFENNMFRVIVEPLPDHRQRQVTEYVQRDREREIL